MIEFSGKKVVIMISLIVTAISICTAALIPGPVFSGEEPKTDIRIRIIVNEYVHVSHEMTTLKDISTIEAPEFLKESIEKKEVGRSPRPGDMRIMEKTQIESVLRSCRFLPADSDIQIPDRIYIRRDSQEFSLEVIKEKLNAYIDQQLAGKEFDLEQFRVNGVKVYPSGDLDLSFPGGTISPAGGRLSFHADVLVDGQKQDRFMISGWVSVYESLVSAAADIGKGQVIEAESCRIIRVDVSRLRGSFANTLEEIEGKIPKTNLKAGDIINPDQLEDRPVIRKGSMVRIVAQRDNLLIVASGISKEDGSVNQLIRVENISSGKTIRGRVKDHSKVEVIY